jgi:hypothetical protein
MHIFPQKLPSETTWYSQRFVVIEVVKTYDKKYLLNILLASVMFYILSSKISFFYCDKNILMVFAIVLK